MLFELTWIGEQRQGSTGCCHTAWEWSPASLCGLGGGFLASCRRGTSQITQNITSTTLWLSECADILTMCTNKGLYPGRSCSQPVNRKHQNTEKFFRDQNWEGLIPPKSFTVPIILKELLTRSCICKCRACCSAGSYLTVPLTPQRPLKIHCPSLTKDKIHQFKRLFWVAVPKKKVGLVWGDKPRHA